MSELVFLAALHAALTFAAWIIIPAKYQKELLLHALRVFLDAFLPLDDGVATQLSWKEQPDRGLDRQTCESLSSGTSQQHLRLSAESLLHVAHQIAHDLHRRSAQPLVWMRLQNIHNTLIDLPSRHF